MYGLSREFRELVPFLKQVSTGEYRVWRLSAMVSNQNLHPCLQSEEKLVGIVATNALMYEAKAPAFARNRLAFQVSGLHQSFTGRLTRGNYDLVISAEAARCLYGFKKVPLVAEVEVSTEQGEEQVASVASSQRRGWLRVSASNFTFSNPKISVRIKKKPRRPREVDTGVERISHQ